MAGQPIFRGQGFSLLRDKNRFVLPAPFRSVLKDKNHNGELRVSFNKHPDWTCLIGYGDDYSDAFADLIDQEKREAKEEGRSFNAMVRGAQLFNDYPTPFDAGGRFVMPEDCLAMAHIEDQIFFLSVGQVFLAWNPEELYAMGDEWGMAKTACRNIAQRELGKAARK